MQLVSILMPVRNALPYLKECVESIEKQSYSNWELVVIDNQSTDGSYEWLLERAQSSGKINVLRNLGEPEIHVSIPKGLGECKGEFVTRMDADDLMHPDKLKLLVKGWNGEKSISVGQVEYFSEEGIGQGYSQYAEWLNSNVMTQNPFEMIYKECVVPSPAWLMKREDLVSDGLLDNLKVPDDYLFCFGLMAKGYTISPVNRVVHYWRDYASRNSRQDERYNQVSFIALKIEQYIKLRMGNIDVVPIVWGAGPNGKLIAKELLKQRCQFHWVTENEKKLGRDIYGVILKGPETIMNASEVIVAVSNKEEQRIVIEKIKRAGAMPVPFC